MSATGASSAHMLHHDAALASRALQDDERQARGSFRRLRRPLFLPHLCDVHEPGFECLE